MESSALLAPVAIGELVMNTRWAGSAGDSLRPKAVIATVEKRTLNVELRGAARFLRRPS